MTDPIESLRVGIPVFESAMRALLKAPAVPLGQATPPPTTGVYAFVHDGTIKYVGEAIGSKGLRDRLLSKHISGDKGHTLQRIFSPDFPIASCFENMSRFTCMQSGTRSRPSLPHQRSSGCSSGRSVQSGIANEPYATALRNAAREQ